jgi:hypothetical protein
MSVRRVDPTPAIFRRLSVRARAEVRGDRKKTVTGKKNKSKKKEAAPIFGHGAGAGGSVLMIKQSNTH